MNRLVERLTELRRHLAHLQKLRREIRTAAQLQQDLSLHNDVLFSLLTVCQLVIDIAGELSSRKNLRFDDYATAIRNLRSYEEFNETVLERLTALPGFRNVLVHEYLVLDMERVVEALNDLAPIEEFADAVHLLEMQD